MINVNDLSLSIARELKKYSAEIDESIQVSRKEVAKEGVKTLRRTSLKKTGSYSKGWRVKQVGIHSVIHNETDYQLTHLLENSHIIRNEHGTYGRTEPIKHIEPVERMVVQEFTERVEKAIK